MYLVVSFVVAVVFIDYARAQCTTCDEVDNVLLKQILASQQVLLSQMEMLSRSYQDLKKDCADMKNQTNARVSLHL